MTSFSAPLVNNDAPNRRTTITDCPVYALIFDSSRFAPPQILWYPVAMVKSLELAIAELANLPDADQEQIDRRLLSHVEKLRQLRTEVDKGIRSLDAGEGRPLDVEESVKQKNERHGRG